RAAGGGLTRRDGRAHPRARAVARSRGSDGGRPDGAPLPHTRWGGRELALTRWSPRELAQTGGCGHRRRRSRAGTTALDHARRAVLAGDPGCAARLRVGTEARAARAGAAPERASGDTGAADVADHPTRDPHRRPERDR